MLNNETRLINMEWFHVMSLTLTLYCHLIPKEGKTKTSQERMNESNEERIICIISLLGAFKLATVIFLLSMEQTII